VTSRSGSGNQRGSLAAVEIAGRLCSLRVRRLSKARWCAFTMYLAQEVVRSPRSESTASDTRVHSALVYPMRIPISVIGAFR